MDMPIVGKSIICICWVLKNWESEVVEVWHHDLKFKVFQLVSCKL